MMNKRGDSNQIGLIIGLILAGLVLVFLIVGWNTTWNPFYKLIHPTNWDALKEECKTICGLGQEAGFCSVERTLNINEEKLNVRTSCAVLANSPSFEKYNFEKCSFVTCDLACEDIAIDSKKGILVLEGATAKYDVGALANNLEAGKKCAIN